MVMLYIRVWRNICCSKIALGGLQFACIQYVEAISVLRFISSCIQMCVVTGGGVFTAHLSKHATAVSLNTRIIRDLNRCKVSEW